MSSEINSTYNLLTIRNLICSSFDDTTFVTFCNENFPSAVEQFSVQMGFLWKIQWLLHHCIEQQQLDDLLQQLQKHHPHTYEQFQSAVFTPPAPPATTSTDNRTIRLELNSGSAHQQPPLRQAFLVALAQVLHLAPQQLTNLQLDADSHWLQLDLPLPAASQLLSWSTNEDPLLRGLGIQRVALYLPPEQRQAITEISQQAIAQLAPEEVDLARPFIDPLIDMTLLDQQVTIRPETTFGGLGSNKLGFLLVVPIAAIAYWHLLTKIEQSSQYSEERLQEMVSEGVNVALKDIEASFSRTQLEQFRTIIESRIFDVAKSYYTTFIGNVQGSVHTGSGDMIIQAKGDDVQALADKDQSTQTTSFNKVALLALIIVVVILILLVLALSIIA